jgi:hypothetical protein
MIHLGQFFNQGSRSPRCAPVTGTTTTYINGAGTVLHYVPYSGYYNYSLGIWLMTAAELGAAKQFTGLLLEKAYTEPSGITQLNQTIKMYHTTATELPASTINTSGTFGSGLTLNGVNAFLPVSDETTVFDSSWFQTSAAGWKDLTFSTNFCYNGTDNVVFMWINNDGAYDSTNYPFWDTDSTSASTNKGAYQYSDTVKPTSVNRSSVRPHLQLKY